MGEAPEACCEGVFRAGMDGSKISWYGQDHIVKGFGDAYGIQIDIEKRRLYWANRGYKRILSSNVDGGDVVILHQLYDAGPYGLALLGDRLYWGHLDSNLIQTGGTQPGSNVRVEYIGSGPTGLFTAPVWNPPTNRTNPCNKWSCSASNVCVLGPNSIRCVNDNN